MTNCQVSNIVALAILVTLCDNKRHAIPELCRSRIGQMPLKSRYAFRSSRLLRRSKMAEFHVVTGLVAKRSERTGLMDHHP